jgi:hypothetical protein
MRTRASEAPVGWRGLGQKVSLPFVIDCLLLSVAHERSPLRMESAKRGLLGLEDIGSRCGASPALAAKVHFDCSCARTSWSTPFTSTRHDLVVGISCCCNGQAHSRHVSGWHSATILPRFCARCCTYVVHGMQHFAPLNTPPHVSSARFMFLLHGNCMRIGYHPAASPDCYVQVQIRMQVATEQQKQRVGKPRGR